MRQECRGLCRLRNVRRSFQLSGMDMRYRKGEYIMSENIVIRKCGNGYDVKVYLNGALIKKAWGYDKIDAYRKARIFADYYRDDNGQSGNITEE